jgi:hypothetical protein
MDIHIHTTISNIIIFQNSKKFIEIHMMITWSLLLLFQKLLLYCFFKKWLGQRRYAILQHFCTHHYWLISFHNHISLRAQLVPDGMNLCQKIQWFSEIYGFTRSTFGFIFSSFVVIVCTLPVCFLCRLNISLQKVNFWFTYS